MKSNYDFLAIRYQNKKGKHMKIKPFSIAWFFIIILGAIYGISLLTLPIFIAGFLGF